VSELEAMGVRRISVGGALARVAYGALLEAAREIAQRGTFTALALGMTFDELNGAFVR
jgi:methylisocitrate lyase